MGGLVIVGPLQSREKVVRSDFGKHRNHGLSA